MLCLGWLDQVQRGGSIDQENSDARCKPDRAQQPTRLFIYLCFERLSETFKVMRHLRRHFLAQQKRQRKFPFRPEVADVLLASLRGLVRFAFALVVADMRWADCQESDQGAKMRGPPTFSSVVFKIVIGGHYQYIPTYLRYQTVLVP